MPDKLGCSRQVAQVPSGRCPRSSRGAATKEEHFDDRVGLLRHTLWLFMRCIYNRLGWYIEHFEPPLISRAGYKYFDLWQTQFSAATNAVRSAHAMAATGVTF